MLFLSHLNVNTVGAKPYKLVQAGFNPHLTFKAPFCRAQRAIYISLHTHIFIYTYINR